jgi:hypothetical protein
MLMITPLPTLILEERTAHQNGLQATPATSWQNLYMTCCTEISGQLEEVEYTDWYIDTGNKYLVGMALGHLLGEITRWHSSSNKRHCVMRLIDGI